MQEFKCKDCGHSREDHEVGAWGTRFSCEFKNCTCIEFEFQDEKSLDNKD